MTLPFATDPSVASQDTLALEAARYALLRRLAPALRHEAVGQLQPIAMVSSVLERRLAQPSPELGPLQEGVRRLTQASRTAVQACVDIIGWLAPETGEPLPLHEAVQETADLLRGPLGFRGFTLRPMLEGASDPVSRASLRQVLPACVLWLTDQAGPPAEVRVRVAAAPGPGPRPLVLQLSLEPTEGEAGTSREAAHRSLRFEEVEAIARGEGITLQNEGDTLLLQLPRAG